MGEGQADAWLLARLRANASVPRSRVWDPWIAAKTGESVGTARRAAGNAAFGTDRRAAGSAAMLMTDDATLNRLVGRNIRLARTSAQLSQGELGARINQDRREISRWERGVIGPSRANLFRIAQALDQPFGWFYSEHPEA